MRALKTFPIGGFVFFTRHLADKETTKEGIQHYQRLMKQFNAPPLLVCSDEKGGGVSRVLKKFSTIEYASASVIGQEGVSAASESGVLVGTIMKEIGFNVNFAPVADIASSDSSIMRGRSYSDNAESVSEISSAFVRSLQSLRIAATAKHFPGLGSTSLDTHNRMVTSDISRLQIMSAEIIPFTQLIFEDVKLVMVSHVVFDSLDEGIPASLSPRIVESLLRDELGFKGVIITDALNMKSITLNYSSAEAAVQAIKAGCDLLLLPNNFSNAVKGVINAVKNGEISEERIDESIRRIFALKKWIGQ